MFLRPALFGLIVLVLLYLHGEVPDKRGDASYERVTSRGNVNMYSISDKGFAKLKNVEGFEPEPYLDSAGNATIGHGHKIRKGELFGRITEQVAEIILRADVAPIEKFINIHLKTIVTQNQFDALVMFIFNIGEGAFLSSHVFQDLKSGSYDQATKVWAKWINISEMVHDKKTGAMIKKLVPVDGLIKRRAIEIQMFNS